MARLETRLSDSIKRGEIWHLDLEPTLGQEQQGQRYALIVSPDAFNRVMSGLVMVVPITIGGVSARHKGFTVSLMGAGTNATGVVLCNQLRTMDIRARNGQRKEAVPDFILSDVLAKLAAFFE